MKGKTIMIENMTSACEIKFIINEVPKAGRMSKKDAFRPRGPAATVNLNECFKKEVKIQQSRAVFPTKITLCNK
jgi:hypothetical protein